MPIVSTSSPRTFDDLMLVDFSKNRITEETLAKLQDLAKETELADAIKSMFLRREDQPHRRPCRAARGAAQP